MSERRGQLAEVSGRVPPRSCGVAEAVLSRCAGAAITRPYRWLARAVSADATSLSWTWPAGRVRCRASSPAGTYGGRPRPRRRGARAGRPARAGALGSCRRPGAALRRRQHGCSDELDRPGRAHAAEWVIEECARVLRPGGVLAAIAPALRPLGPRDLRVLTRINARLRTKPQFPGPWNWSASPRRRMDTVCVGVEDAPGALPVHRAIARRRRAGDAGPLPAEHPLVPGRAAIELAGGRASASRAVRGRHPDAPASWPSSQDRAWNRHTCAAVE